MESQDIGRIKNDLETIQRALASSIRLGHKWFSLWLALNVFVAAPLSVLVPTAHLLGHTPSLAFVSYYIPTILVMAVWILLTVSWFHRWKSEKNLTSFAAPVVALQLITAIAMIWIGWQVLDWQPDRLAEVDNIIALTNIWSRSYLLCGAYSALLLLLGGKRLFSVTSVLKALLPLFILFCVNAWVPYGTLIVRIIMLLGGLWLILKFSSQIKKSGENDAD